MDIELGLTLTLGLSVTVNLVLAWCHCRRKDDPPADEQRQSPHQPQANIDRRSLYASAALSAVLSARLRGPTYAAGFGATSIGDEDIQVACEVAARVADRMT